MSNNTTQTNAARDAGQPMELPKFSSSRYEMEQIRKIARRAVKSAMDADVDYPLMDAMMDIEACHCNGNALDLSRLMEAKDSDFGHDVFGIRRFIDRSTGRLSGCFVPRCTLRAE